MHENAAYVRILNDVSLVNLHRYIIEIRSVAFCDLKKICWRFCSL